MSISSRRIADNVQRVRDRIATAAKACGRSPAEIRLVAVTKYVGCEEAAALLEAGCRDLGESRPQELWQKAEDPRLASARWHLVGHLQRNKVRRTLPYLSLLHSLDSERLANSIEEHAAAIGERVSVLLEVNCFGDVEKHGLTPGDVEPVVERLLGLDHVRLRGLMTMAARGGGREVAQRNFAELRQLREDLRSRLPTVELTELSMGMSGDLEEAVQQGATIVRVGSALFQ